MPCLGTFHNAGPTHVGYRLFARWLAPLAERLDLRIAVSRCAAEYAGRHFPGEYLVIPNGVDPVRFHPRPAAAGTHRQTVLFVGGLEPRKGLDTLIEALAIESARAAIPPRLVVVGDGSLRQRLLREARSARIDFEWHGRVSPEEMPDDGTETPTFSWRRRSTASRSASSCSRHWRQACRSSPRGSRDFPSPGRSPGRAPRPARGPIRPRRGNLRDARPGAAEGHGPGCAPGGSVRMGKCVGTREGGLSARCWEKGP